MDYILKMEIFQEIFWKYSIFCNFDTDQVGDNGLNYYGTT